MSSQRVIGKLAGDPVGPTVIVLAGIHGNEPAGVRAARRVIEGFERDRPALCGTVLFLAGNLQALNRQSRFIDLDLNRQWTPENVRALASPAAADDPAEHREQRELLCTLSAATEAARGQVYFLDLHTSSASGPPFVTVGDTLRNRRFAKQLPLPLILGLEEQVDGALLELLNNRGFVTLGVEGGHHDAEESVAYHEAVLWLALVAAGAVDEAALPGRERYRELLRSASQGTPRVVEVRRRHAITPEDGFEMQPDYRNFQTVRQGELLARDRRGAIHAPEDGRILLPLYQGQGDDGFFICREFRPFWLTVSAVLRHLHLYRLIPLLPAVRRHPDVSDALIVNTRIARWYPLEIFHLFGFRKLRKSQAELIVSRRRYDLEPPSRISIS